MGWMLEVMSIAYGCKLQVMSIEYGCKLEMMSIAYDMYARDDEYITWDGC